MLLNTQRRGMSVYRAAYYAPSIVAGSVAVALMWRQVFGPQGVVNAVLALLGVPRVSWLGQPGLGDLDTDHARRVAVRLADADLPGRAPADPGRALRGGGDRRRRGLEPRFFRITLPLLSPVTFFNLVMQTITGFMVFTQAFIVTGGGPMDTTLFYALYLYRRAFESFQMGYASAMAWVLLLAVALCTAVLFKTSGRWVFYEAKEGR